MVASFDDSKAAWELGGQGRRTKVGVLGVQGLISDPRQLEPGRVGRQGAIGVFPGVEVELPDACARTSLSLTRFMFQPCGSRFSWASQTLLCCAQQKA